MNCTINHPPPQSLSLSVPSSISRGDSQKAAHLVPPAAQRRLSIRNPGYVGRLLKVREAVLLGRGKLGPARHVPEGAVSHGCHLGVHLCQAL